jgi:hypothetical protein
MLTEYLQDWKGDTPLAQAIATIHNGDEAVGGHAEVLLDLVRLCRDEPGLRAVWLEARYNAETVFAAMIADRTNRPADDLAVRLEAAC